MILLISGIFIYRKKKKNRFEFLSALSAPTQKEHSRAMLLAGEDMDMDDNSFGMGGVRGSRVTTGSGSISYRDNPEPTLPQIAFPHTTPWDSDLDPRSSMEALHHPSRNTSEAKDYVAQYLSRARGSSGSVFQEDLGMSELPVVNRYGETEGHSRNVSGASQTPLLAPPSPGTPGMGIVSGPARPSPLKSAIGRPSTSDDHGSTEENTPMARTKNWIERTVNNSGGSGSGARP